MHTLSSASLTCIASRSAVEYTATVAIPSSFAARKTRSAISPRLAIRILSNIGVSSPVPNARSSVLSRSHSMIINGWSYSTGAAIGDKYANDFARVRRDNVIEGFHGFDQQQFVSGHDRRSKFDKWLRFRSCSQIGSSDHRRFHRPRERGCRRVRSDRPALLRGCGRSWTGLTVTFAGDDSARSRARRTCRSPG